MPFEWSLMRRSRLLIMLACLAVFGLQAWVEWGARFHQIRETEDSLANLASSLAVQAEDTIDVADTVLSLLVERVETYGTSPESLASINRKLAAQVNAGARYRSVTVVDAHGDTIASSFPNNQTNVSTREYFIHHRDDPDRGPYISHPIQSRETGHWILTVTRRIQAPDGSFAGVAFVSIELSYFSRLFGTYNLGPKSLITLLMPDGTLLARHPDDPTAVSRNLSKAKVLSVIKQAPAGSYQTTAVSDGVERFSGYRASSRFPLIVVASVPVEHALRDWRANAILHMAITLALTAGIGLLGFYLTREVRRSQTAERALRRAQVFLDRASSLAGVGGWAIDIATNEIAWSAETRRIYGLEPGQMPTVQQAIDHFAPEARTAIAAAFERCKRYGDGWDLELPFDRAGGRRLWVRSVGTLVRDDGEAAQITGALQDITERVIERQALEAANNRVTLATDSGRIGLWEWDLGDDTLLWDSWMYRLYGTARPPGRQTIALWRHHLHPEDRDAAEQAVRDAMDGSKPYISEFRVVWADGSVHHIRGSGRVVRDADGRAVRMVGANWDVTELAAQNHLLARAERDAAAAAAQYRLLAENSTDMIFIIDRQRRRRFVSPGSRDVLGYAPEELIGGDPATVIHPDDAPTLVAIFDAMFGGRESAAATVRSRHRDGHWVWVDAVFKLVRDPTTGEPWEVTGSIRDVTERVAAETALRESEGRYRLLLESGVIEAFYLLDPNGTIQTWNAGAERIKGWTPEETIGRDFSTFFTPEDLAKGEPARLLAMARDTGQVRAEGWRVRKDGSRFLASVVIDAIRGEDGTLVGFAKAARDITERRIEEEQRAMILEATPTGILIADESGTITLANSHVEQLFDYPAGALAGQKLEILVPETVRDTHVALRSAFAAGQSERAMAEGRAVAGRRRDGTEVLIEIMLRPVRTPRGAIVVASLRDVTERLRLAAEQQERERQERLAIETTNTSLDRLARHLAKARDASERASLSKTRFLAGMSHELRTPLNGILGYAQLLHLEGGLNPTQSARVDSMLQAGKHLLGMIARVLDLSEIETEHVELTPVMFALLPVAEACMDLIRPAAEAKGLKLSIEFAPGTPRDLTADVTRLRQVLLNLLGNAVKFTRAGGIALRLRPRPDGLALRIEVADTGAGIPADQRKLLFQDFERLDTDATRAAEGAGLGLALSARLAALMGGRLDHADNPGGGSVFWLELPLNVTAAAQGSAAKRAPVSQRVLHVLVVDDAEMNRDVAGSFLRAAGHLVTMAEGGAEAVAAASNTDFDVVLMDVRMPGMDGLEAARRIRGLDGRRGRVPIVALTAQTFSEQVAACQAAGMDSHVGKPFDMAELLDAVARAAGAGSSPREAVPAAAASPDAATPSGSDMATIDEKQFALTTDSLGPRTAALHIRTLLETAEVLLRELNQPDAQSDGVMSLSDTLHTLAGSSGLFGFRHLSLTARDLETAMRAGTGDVRALAAALRTATEATRQAIGGRAPG